MGTVYFVNLDCDPETDKKFHWDYYYYCGIIQGKGGRDNKIGLDWGDFSLMGKVL